MKRTIFFSLFLLWSFAHYSQTINGIYGIDTLTYNLAEDYINDAVFNQSQHLFVAGGLQRATPANPLVVDLGTLSRFDENGDLVYSLSTSFEDINSIIRTPEGHLLLTGEGTGLLCNGVCKADFWVAEADENGQFIWGRSFGNIINDGNDIGYAGAIMSNGDRLCVGYYYHSTYNSKIFIARMNAQGDTIWTKSYGMYTGQQIGYSVFVNTNDDIYIGGTTTMGGGLLLLKLNSNGSLNWAKTYVTPAGRILKILKKSDGTLLLCGQAIANGDYMVNLTNVDLNGSIIWSKDYGVENSDNEQFFEDAFLTVNDDLFLTGYYYDEVNYVTPGNKPFYMKLDAIGNVQWAKRYTAYYGEGRIIKPHPVNGIIWGGIHMQNAFTPFWSKQPEIWWFHMNQNGDNDCFTPCNIVQSNASAVASNKNFSLFTGYVTDDPIPSSTSYLTLKSSKCNSPLDLENIETMDFQVVPNPSEGKFKIKGSKEIKGNIQIIDGVGKVRTISVEHNQDIYVSLTPGIYILKFLEYGHTEKIVIY